MVEDGIDIFYRNLVVNMKIKKKIYSLCYLIIYRFVQPKLIVTQCSFSGDGSFIDIRYWLSRPDKINPKISPYIITAQNERLVLMNFSKFGVVKSKFRKHTNSGILLFYNKNKEVSIEDDITLYWDGLIAENIVMKK